MSEQAPDRGDDNGFGSVAGELKQESEKLRQLADKLQTQQVALSEMGANYPHLRQFVYAKLREEFRRTLPELPDTDLEALARQEGAVPLEAFIDKLEREAGGP
jgi:hypothetical protein